MSAPREQLLLALEQSPVIDAGDADAAARLICETGSLGLEVDRCTIWRLSDDGESMRCIHLFDAADGGHHDEPGVTIDRADYPRYFAALRSERSIVAGNAANHPFTGEFAVGYLDVLGLSALLDGPSVSTASWSALSAPNTAAACATGHRRKSASSPASAIFTAAR